MDSEDAAFFAEHEQRYWSQYGARLRYQGSDTHGWYVDLIRAQGDVYWSEFGLTIRAALEKILVKEVEARLRGYKPLGEAFDIPH